MIRVVCVAGVVSGVWLMHGLATPEHDMTTHSPVASIEKIVGSEMGFVHSTDLDGVHAGALCLWVLTGGIAAVAIRRALRIAGRGAEDRFTLGPAPGGVTWPGPAPPGHWSYLELNTVRR